MSQKITIIMDRLDHLEKRVKELEKEMHRYQGDQPDPEKESPPFKSWVK